MTSGDVSSFLIYVSGALILSIAGIFGLSVGMEVEARLRRFAVPALYMLILLTEVISTSVSGRNVYTALLHASYAADPLTKGIVRLAIVTTLTICVSRILGAAWSKENRDVGGAGIFLAFLLYFVTNSVLNAALGVEPVFRHDLYYAPFLFAAVFASRTQDPETAIGSLKWGLLMFFTASCLVATVAPDLTIDQRYADSWLPGMPIRFWGLSTNPNSLGPLAVLYVLLAVHQPIDRRWLHYLGILIAVSVLVLTQSKTAWAAAAVTVPILLVLRSRPTSPPRRRHRTGASYVMGLAVTSVFIVGPIGVAAVWGLSHWGVSIQDVMTMMAGRQVATLTGRDIVWELAMRAWARNPLFGYGVTIWDSTYRAEIGLLSATSAHNQFLQSLSAAGIVGLVGLLVYVGALTRYAIAASPRTHGLSVAVLLLLFFQCITETPLSIATFLGGEFLQHLLLFQIVLVHGSRAGPEGGESAPVTRELQGAP
jgi:exopolysaccharide production protein ExoQ